MTHIIWLPIFLILGGSISLFSAGNKHLDRKKDRITLLPVGNIQKWVLESLTGALERTFGCPVETDEKVKLPAEAFNQRRNQYSSSKILEEIHSFVKPESQEKVLAIADVDLYVSGLNFVFGEAELGGHLALISLCRLRQSFYGRPENKTLFMERAVKEAVHELGHVYGLAHCPDTECVMHFSNSLMDTDRKSSSFCSRCRQELQKLSSQ